LRFRIRVRARVRVRVRVTVRVRVRVRASGVTRGLSQEGEGASLERGPLIVTQA